MGQRGWGFGVAEDAIGRAKAIEGGIRNVRGILKLLIGFACAVRWASKRNTLGGAVSGAAIVGCIVGAVSGASGAVESGLAGQVASLIGDIFSLILTALGFLM